MVYFFKSICHLCLPFWTLNNSHKLRLSNAIALEVQISLKIQLFLGGFGLVVGGGFLPLSIFSFYFILFLQYNFPSQSCTDYSPSCHFQFTLHFISVFPMPDTQDSSSFIYILHRNDPFPCSVVTTACFSA